MKWRVWLLLVAACVAPARVSAQEFRAPLLAGPTTLTTAADAAATCVATSCVTLATLAYSGVSVQVTGNCTDCLLKFALTLDDPASPSATWTSMSLNPLPTGTGVTETASAGLWQGGVIARAIRVWMSELGSGSFVVSLRGAPSLSANGGGGGGTPGGDPTDVQFNSSGVFGGSAKLTWDGSQFTVGPGPAATTFGTAAPLVVSLLSQGDGFAIVNQAFDPINAVFHVQVEDDGRVYIGAFEPYLFSQDDITIEATGSLDVFTDTQEIAFTPTIGKITVYSPGPSFSQHLDFVTMTSGSPPTADLASAVTIGGSPISYASKSETLTNKTIDGEGTGNTITLPFTLSYSAAVCQNATATIGANTPTSNPAVAACVTGSNTQFGVADFAASSNLSMQGHFPLPSDWTGVVDWKGKWFSSTTSGNVVWQVATACVADGETSDPSFNTASTVTDAAKGTTNQQNDVAITGVTTTGCAAGEEMYWKLSRNAGTGSDTMSGTARLVSFTFVVRRAI